MVRPGRRLDVGANKLSQVRTGHSAESEIKEGPEPSSQQNKSTGGSLLRVTQTNRRGGWVSYHRSELGGPG